MFTFPLSFTDPSTCLKDREADGNRQSHTISILKYGSDPLKTYLPDSDIDVTIILNNNLLKIDDDQPQNMDPLKQLQLIQEFLKLYQKISNELIDDLGAKD